MHKRNTKLNAISFTNKKLHTISCTVVEVSIKPLFSDEPEVVLRMSPSSPINELDRRNVTLFCDVISGNPATLNSVKWFMDGELLIQLPMCHNELEYEIFYPKNSIMDLMMTANEHDLCDVDPSKLLLFGSKIFHGNFSCEATNDAGWSERSPEESLEIYCKSIHKSSFIYIIAGITKISHSYLFAYSVSL